MNNENKGIHPTGVSSRVWIALVALCVANVVAHLMVMPSLPAQIPTHWGANGAVDGWGPSWMASALGVLPLALLAMFCVVPRIDPKGEAYRTSGKFYQGFVILHLVHVRHKLAGRAYGLGRGAGGRFG